jgi:hypothetical protein
MKSLLTIGLRGGAELIWPSGASLVQVGDHGMPERVIYRHPGGDNQPGCVIEVEVWDGVPVCSRAEIIGKSHEQIPVRAKDLKALAGMIDSVIEAAGITFGHNRTVTGWGLGFPGSDGDQLERRRSVQGARRKLSAPGFLERVAHVYEAAPKPKLEVIADEFDCSERSAARYVAAAREAGLIHE